MKDTKFRAWDKKRKEWIPGNLLFMDYDGQVLGGDVYNPPFVLISPRNVSFFTGLIDINNKEVFERDIVKFADGYGIIRYEPKLATYEIEYLSNPKCYITIPNLFSEVGDQWLEVVGNEYENPNYSDEIE